MKGSNIAAKGASLFVCWYVRSLVCSLVGSFVGSLVCLLVRWLVRSLVGLFVGWFVRVVGYRSDYKKNRKNSPICQVVFLAPFVGSLESRLFVRMLVSSLVGRLGE